MSTAPAIQWTEEDVKASLAKDSLRDFVETAWPYVEPSAPFVPNWHIDLLCRELEAVTRGETKRLIVNIPPGCAKSLIVSVFWPAWEWASDPSKRYLTASYGSHLTIRDNLRVRAICRSEWYQHYFKLRFHGDQNAKERFNTTETGWRIATSVGGVGTGEHPDRIIVDDPHTAQQARSDKERKTAITWFDSTVSSRGVVRDVAIVLIMQRLHEEDLTGHLLAKGGWRHVCLPMRYEAEKVSDKDPRTFHDEDPRTEPGDLLWPGLFTEERVRQLELDLGPFGAAGQLQQRPAPEGGGLFKREWFDIVDAAPARARRCRGWDVAGTDGGGAYTAGVKMCEADGIFYVEDVKRGQWSDAAVDREMKDAAVADGRDSAIREEQEPGSSGKKVIAVRRRMLVGFDYSGVSASGDKVTKARPFRAQCEGKNVKLVRGPWNNEYLDELVTFPTGKYKDQVDASAVAFNELATSLGYVRVRKSSWG